LADSDFRLNPEATQKKSARRKWGGAACDGPFFNRREDAG